MKRSARLRKASRLSLGWVCLVAMAAGLGWSASAAAEDPPIEPPTVVELEPSVAKLIGTESRELHLGEELAYGDEIRTGPRAWAAIALGSNGILDIGSDTTAVIRGSEDLEVDLVRGRLLISLSRAFRGGLWIKAPSVALGIRGTQVAVRVSDDGTRLSVFEGEVVLKGLGLTVREGSQILVKLDGEALPPSPISLWESTSLQQSPQDPAPGDSRLLDQINPRLFTRD